MEKDLNKLLLERDILKSKEELKLLRAENEKLMQLVNEKIENARDNITEKALEKSMAVFDKIITWLRWSGGILLALVVFAGFLGYNSLEKKLTEYYTDSVRGWLRFDDNNTGGYKALDELRTNAMLDSLMLKYERAKIRNKYLSPNSINFSEKEKLMELISDSSTSDENFDDALTILVNFSAFSEDNDILYKKLMSILNDKNTSDNKKRYIFPIIESSNLFYPVAVEMMSNEFDIFDERIFMSAFRNILKYNDVKARDLAVSNFNRLKYIGNKVELAKALINANIRDDLVSNLLNEMKDKSGSLNYYYIQLVIYKVNKLINNNELEKAAALMSDLIENVDSISDIYKSSVVNDEHIVLRNTIVPIKGFRASYYGNFSDLIANNELINLIIRSKSLDIIWLERIISFFQIEDKDLFVSTFMMKPNPLTSIKLDNGRIVKGKEILDYVWLRTENKAGESIIISSWRDKAGKIHEGILVGIDNLSDSEFRIELDDYQFRSYFSQLN